MFSALRLVLVTALFVLCAGWLGSASQTRADGSSADAWSADTGTLIVKAVDSKGKPIAGATVQAFPSGSSTVAASGVTNANGKFTFTLDAGDYFVTASKLTFVGSFPVLLFGTGQATVTAGKTSGLQITLLPFTF